jgi:hypothetical protein
LFDSKLLLSYGIMNLSPHSVTSVSGVVEFDATGAGNAHPTLRDRRLLQLSRALTLLFTVFVCAALLWILAAVFVTAFFSDHIRVGASAVYITIGKATGAPGAVLYSEQPLLTRVAGVLDIVVATVPLLFIFWELRGLFRLYARGIVFSGDNAVHLRRTGLWLVAYPFAKFSANALFQLAGGTDKAWFSMTLIHSLVLGLIVLAMSLVMEFGTEVEQEKDSFV